MQFQRSENILKITTLNNSVINILEKKQNKKRNLICKTKLTKPSNETNLELRILFNFT